MTEKIWHASVLGAAVVAAAVMVWGAPSVYPTGVTISDPAKTWNGYTVLSPLGGQDAVVIDMNGAVVKKWGGFNSSAGGPVRVLPGGVVIGATGAVAGKQESLALVEQDFNGKELWRFDHNEKIQSKGGEESWATRQHHDWQREDFPAGYYSPGSSPGTGTVKTLLLTHRDRAAAGVAGDTAVQDDRLIEIDGSGKVLWEWMVGDHIEELHFDKDAREAIRVGAGGGRGGFDWFHTNSATYVGPNHWYDEGDKRFAPENVIISSRAASIVAIVSRDGKIVWQMGPDYNATPELRAIRQVIGQHHAHIIPKGLPGAGNMMIFDNGGASGYGRPSGVAPKGENVFARPTSRVLEIDPVTLKLVWSYAGTGFFATNISGAQRLPNGNTLITEGPDGRVFEVDRDGTIVWEYVYPSFTGKGKGTNTVYRAYRVPYEWIPQVTHAKELAVTAPAAGDFRVPGAK